MGCVAPQLVMEGHSAGQHYQQELLTSSIREKQHLFFITTQQFRPLIFFEPAVRQTALAPCLGEWVTHPKHPEKSHTLMFVFISASLRKHVHLIK